MKKDTWVWDQSAGQLWLNDKLISSGYAGRGKGKNNPLMQDARGVGPLPRGMWLIVGAPYDSPNTGKYTIKLRPAPGTNTFGRSEFRIHGDSIKNPGTASRGCIILPPAVRRQIVASGLRDLEVVE